MRNTDIKKEYLHLLSGTLLLRTLVLIFTDTIHVVFAIQLGNLTDIALQQNGFTFHDVAGSLALFLMVILIDPILLYFSNRMLLKTSLEADQLLFAKVLDQAPERIGSHDSGELAKRIQDDGIAYRWALIDLVCYGGEMLYLVVMLLFLSMYYSVVYTLFILVLVVAGWRMTYAFTKQCTHWEQQKMTANEQMYHRFMNCFGHFAESKINQYTKLLYAHMKSFLQETTASTYVPQKHKEVQKQESTYAYDRFAYLAIAVFGMYLVSSHQASLGLLVMMTYLYTILSHTLKNMEYILSARHMLSAMEKRIAEYTDLLLPVVAADFASLSVEDVHFSYGNDRSFHYEDITIHKGDKVVITGENGTGKTTLLKLICGFYPVSGGMRLNQQPFDRSHMRSMISYIDVEANMFHEDVTSYIRANLSSNEEVYTSLCDVQMDSLKDASTDTLSGGERKRVDLCRVMLEQRGIIVMDEPEAFLDERGKQLFYEAIRDSRATIIYTSHDAYLSSAATKIVTLS